MICLSEEVIAQQTIELCGGAEAAAGKHVHPLFKRKSRRESPTLLAPHDAGCVAVLSCMLHKHG